MPYGFTNTGCPRCAWAIRYGYEHPTTLSHSTECRERLREAIRASGEAGRQRVEASERRHATAEQARAATATDAPAEGENTDAAAGAAVGESAGDYGTSEDPEIPAFERFSGHEEFNPWGSRKPPGPGAGDIPSSPMMSPASPGMDEDMGQSLAP